MEKERICNSCKSKVSGEGAAKFLCPKCGKEDIIRCQHCRKIAAKYKCSCGFTGPN